MLAEAGDAGRGSTLQELEVHWEGQEATEGFKVGVAE